MSPKRFIAADGQPVLIDRFLEDATEVDVDALSDGPLRRDGDHGTHRRSRRALGRFGLCDPSFTLSPAILQRSAKRPQAGQAAVGRRLMNIQFAVKDEDGVPTLYVLEVNPRASRTVPFVAKATGVRWQSWRPR
jgi:carbamoyl-phosphate synthase large subunit